MVIQFDPKDGTTIKSFISPAGEPRGITFDGKYLWISDRSTDEIYMVHKSMNTNGNALFAGNNDAQTIIIYLMGGMGEIISKFQLPGKTCQQR